MTSLSPGVSVGAAVVTVDVPVGTPMAGYAARTGGATGTHDPCTVRALAVDDTCWVTVDVCGLHEVTVAEIETRVGGAPGQLAVTATHTHSGPVCTPGRLGGDDSMIRRRIVDAVVDAVESARTEKEPVFLRWSSTRGIGVAVDRREPGRPIDPPVELVRFERLTGGGEEVVAWLVTYPCHPVVLSAANRLVSGDYAAALRSELERRAPGSVALFLPGTAGDVNDGHAAEASFTTGEQPRRTFQEAERIGLSIARTALNTAPTLVETLSPTASLRRSLNLCLEPLDAEPLEVSVRRWEQEGLTAPEGQAAVLQAWVDWARARSVDDPLSWDAAVTVMQWGDLTLVGLPGEPFLACGEQIQAAIRADRAERGVTPGPVVVTGYTNGCPGYLPDAEAYAHGGYEVLDAHRYYGMPAPFARGSVERLQELAVELSAELLDELSDELTDGPAGTDGGRP